MPRNKLCEAITDAIRLARLEEAGYRVAAKELTDPDDTPKNTLLRAVRKKKFTESQQKELTERYRAALAFITGDSGEDYLKDIL